MNHAVLDRKHFIRIRVSFVTDPRVQAFHVFAIEWSENSIDWYVDDKIYHTVSPSDLNGAWVFNQPFFIILNLAVGGGYVGPPNSSTVFPQTMEVDWVRVYQKQDMTPINELTETKFNIFPNPINNKILNLFLI
mgnify:CR=1 FL=1